MNLSTAARWSIGAGVPEKGDESIFADADEVISVATLKSHLFAGVTLCMKNLFGLCPRPPLGRPRHYFHHFIRLSYVFPDLAMMLQPCLNIIDGLVGQTGREWGGRPRIADTLIAGDHVIATDAVGAWLMGNDPAGDWPNPPYRRERNPIRVAAEYGFGTVDLDEIDLETDIYPPVAEFDSDETDTPEVVHSWRKTACEQALYYQDNQRKIAERHAYRIGWFHCPDCEKRLLWRDCRDALRKTPKCFSCTTTLMKRDDILVCDCGKEWPAATYANSIRARIRLPCPECGASLHRPSLDPQLNAPRLPSETKQPVPCPKCGGSAEHTKGNIQCRECGYKKRWRAFRKARKRKDEKLACHACEHAFTWQGWKRDTRSNQLRTGNMLAVESYVARWPRCRTHHEMMSRIDLLVQAIHGRGALGPVFIQGNDQSIRALLDELAALS